MPSYYRETTSPPNGTEYGQTHDMIGDKYLIAFVYSDEDGELWVEQSHDQTHWHTTEEEVVTAGDPIRIVSEAACRYTRAAFDPATQTPNTFRLLTCRKGDR